MGKVVLDRTGFDVTPRRLFEDDDGRGVIFILKTRFLPDY
jgi:hypothetical protein